MVIPGAAGIVIAVVIGVLGCIICSARCCCKCCCYGDEEGVDGSHMGFRVPIVILYIFVILGAILGVVGNDLTATSVRNFFDEIVVSLTNVTDTIVKIEVDVSMLNSSSGNNVQVDFSGVLNDLYTVKNESKTAANDAIIADEVREIVLALAFSTAMSCAAIGMWGAILGRRFLMRMFAQFFPLLFSFLQSHPSFTSLHYSRLFSFFSFTKICGFVQSFDNGLFHSCFLVGSICNSFDFLSRSGRLLLHCKQHHPKCGDWEQFFQHLHQVPRLECVQHSSHQSE